MRIGAKSIILAIMVVISGFISVIYVQSLRSKGGLEAGLIETTKYYSKSLDNANMIIDKDVTTQSMFWTLRPVLSIPFIPSLLGIIDLYEQQYGALQIQKRADDFTYASDLGVDPSYNTFSSYGYAFLDWGWYGCIIVLFTMLILQGMYKAYLKNHLLASMTYPTLFILSFDQLRTYWFFSEFSMYCIIFSGLICLLQLVYNRRTI
jgi:hypothetical protein